MYLNQIQWKASVNETRHLQVSSEYDGNIIWSSMDSTIATEDETGLVHALRPGTTTIQVMLQENEEIFASCQAKVEESVLKTTDTSVYPTAIAISADNKTLNQGQNFTLTVARWAESQQIRR